MWPSPSTGDSSLAESSGWSPSSSQSAVDVTLSEAAPVGEYTGNHHLLGEREGHGTPKYPDGSEVPRPPHWSGWWLHPGQIEFWLHGDHRLHERLLYKKTSEGWERSILYP